MDHQSMQPGDGGGGSGAATQEWLYPGAGGGGPQVVDGTFLMELLEDAPTTEQPQEDVDQLKRVIQSLEAEIDGRLPPADGGSKPAEHVPAAGDVDGGMIQLDDMLSADLHGSPGPCVAAEAMTMPPFECWWAEVPVGHDMGGWYLDGVLVGVGGYEFREQCYYGYYGEGQSFAVDQVYSPLWE